MKTDSTKKWEEGYLKEINDSSDNLVISKSKLFHGYGVFAKQKIDKWSAIEPRFIGFINDGDFSYPRSFSRTDLDESFKLYRSSNDNHSVTDIETSISIANRDIMPGEELTRRYGERKWIYWLLGDILGINPLGNYGEPENPDALNTFLLFATDNNYSIKIKENLNKELTFGDIIVSKNDTPMFSESSLYKKIFIFLVIIFIFLFILLLNK